MKHFFYAVALLCYGAADGNAQFFNNFDSWPIMEGSSWTQSGPGGTWYGDGTYVNFGNEYSGLRKVGFNDVGDALELPPVTNPESISFYGRLSSGSRVRIALEQYTGRNWEARSWFNAVESRYLFYRSKPRILGENVRLRLRMTVYGNSFYLDNLRVTTFVLPVELAEFTAAAGEDGAVHLHWRTLTETGNERFDVQRSREGRSFETIGIVAGAGTSTTPHSYFYKDTAPYTGIAYYRLRQVDFDGTEAFSPVRSVRIDGNRDALRIASGIVTHTVQLTLQPAGRSRRLLLFDRQGHLVRQVSVPRNAHSATLSVADLARGLYFVKVGSAVGRFVKM